MRSHIPKSELDLLPQLPLFAEQNALGAEPFLLLEDEAVCTIGCMTEETLMPGDYFGELSLLDGGPRIATITASKNCSFSVFNRGKFGTLVRRSPSIAIKLLLHLSSRLTRAAAALIH